MSEDLSKKNLVDLEDAKRRLEQKRQADAKKAASRKVAKSTGSKQLSWWHYAQVLFLLALIALLLKSCNL